MHRDSDGAARPGTRERSTTRRPAYAALIGRMLVVLALMLGGSGQARAQSYAYDSNGRLVATTIASGDSVHYVYDDMGNLQQVVSVPAGTLSIFTLTPNHGSAGVPVTLRGQGFSANAADNLVTFQGAAATVTAATPTSLTTRVPVGAITGTVTVKVGSQTATSDVPFVIDGTGLPPSITSFAPAVVDIGGTVTVQGLQLLPVLGQTSLSLNDQSILPTSLTNTAIGFVAPSTAGSGHVTVQTPFGVATSATDLVVAPSGIGAASIGPVARVTPAVSPTLTIPASKYGVVLFDAANLVGSQWISLHGLMMNGVTSASFSIYDPRGRQVYQGVVTTSAPSIHLPKLTTRGTYSVYIMPLGGKAASITVGMDIAPLITLNAGSPTPVSTIVANQSKRFMFRAVSGMAIELPAIVTAPTGGNVALSVSDDTGTIVGSTSGSTSVAYNLPLLKTGRLYQAVVGTSSGTTVNTSILLASLPGGVLAIDGPTLAVVTDSGVNAAFSFTTAPGDNLEFALNGVTMSSGSFTAADVFIYDPAGTYIAGSTFCSPNNPQGSCRIALPNLAGGTYSVVVKSESPTAAMHLQATLTRDVTGLLAVGVPKTVNLARPGQSGRFTFNATAGDTLAFALGSVVTSPTGQPVTVSVIRPDGTALGSDTTVSSAGAVNLQSLPMTGTYTVFVRQVYGLPMSFQVLLAAQAGGTLTADGPSAVLTPEIGQNGYFSFDAVAGDNFEFALSGVTMRPSCSGVTASIYDSKGNYVAGGTLYSGVIGLGAHLWGLAGGSYSIVVSGCMQTGTVTLTRDVAVTMAIGDTQSFNLSRNGQTLRLAFNGTAGQTVAVGAQTFSTTPTGKAVTTTVLSPDGTRLKSFDGSAPGLLDLRNLAVSGVYTVIVSPDYGVPATVQASVLPQAGGTLVPDGAAFPVSAGVGQSAFFTFNAVAGDNLELAFNALTAGAPATGVSYYVYTASGSTVANGALDNSISAGSNRLSLWGLAAGTYSVTVSSYGGTGRFATTATLTRDVPGTLAVGGSTPVSLSRVGQVARYTFAGTAGQSLTLGLTGYTTTPTNLSLGVTINRPDGTRLSIANLYNGNSFALPALPATGTYTVTLAPANGVTATMNVSLK